MRVMTFGASPYLLVRNGRMNADMLTQAKQEGHDVVSAVWHHDEGYFLPDDGGMHYFDDDNGERICELYPFLPTPNNSEALLYEIMKKTAPDVLISIGDYKEVDFVYSIKAMYPNLFKWIAILPIDCSRVNENRKERIEYADYVISTTEFGWNDISNLCNIQGEHISYGPNHDIFNIEKVDVSWNKSPVFLCSAKNAQASNLGAFIMAMGSVEKSGNEVVGKIHTNLYDPGDYDLDLLLERYGASNCGLPEYFCSIKDSISDSELSKVYAHADFIVETSVKSATALGLLEAMAMGAVPIGMNSGRVGEIISLMPPQFQFFVPFETFIGSCEEEYSVISVEGLSRKIVELKKVYEDIDLYLEASMAAVKVARRISNSEFRKRMTEVIEDVASKDSPIAVETF